MLTSFSNIFSSKRVPRPFLLQPSNFGEASHEFFDLVYGETRYLDLRHPGLYFRGSSYGWVIAMIKDSPEIHLINPLTRLHKQLPPRFKFPDIKECSPGNYVVWATPCTGNYFKPFCGSVHVRDFLTTKYILSSNPSISDTFMAVAIYGQFSRLAYTKFGDDRWTSIKSEDCYSDIIFYREKLYALTKTAQLMDIRIPEVNQITSSSRTLEPHRQLYLVSSSIGLLMVERVLELYDSENNPRTHQVFKTCGFHVYKFDFRSRDWSSSLMDIGDDILFVGSNCSTSVSSNDYPMTRLKGNCIYFSDNFLSLSYKESEEMGYFDIGVFDLRTGGVQRESRNPSNLRHVLSPSPIWVTPVTD
ncbi:hypothetical protein M5689_014204 [Euphorbia peplus]|nr:hypothetical protein M5689_014204 [Euphorbia peplus]